MTDLHPDRAEAAARRDVAAPVFDPDFGRDPDPYRGRAPAETSFAREFREDAENSGRSLLANSRAQEAYWRARARLASAASAVRQADAWVASRKADVRTAEERLPPRLLARKDERLTSLNSIAWTVALGIVFFGEVGLTHVVFRLLLEGPVITFGMVLAVMVVVVAGAHAVGGQLAELAGDRVAAARMVLVGAFAASLLLVALALSDLRAAQLVMLLGVVDGLDVALGDLIPRAVAFRTFLALQLALLLFALFVGFLRHAPELRALQRAGRALRRTQRVLGLRRWWYRRCHVAAWRRRAGLVARHEAACQDVHWMAAGAERRCARYREELVAATDANTASRFLVPPDIQLQVPLWMAKGQFDRVVPPAPPLEELERPTDPRRAEAGRFVTADQEVCTMTSWSLNGTERQ